MDIITITLLILKLVGVITFSWWLVFAPMILMYLTIVGFLMSAFGLAYFVNKNT